MKKNIFRPVGLVAISLCLVGLLIRSTASGAQSQQPAAFSGQATVVQARILGITTVISDTGPLPSEGGAKEASLLEASVPGLLTAEVLHASTVGQGNQSHSEASVANLDLTVGGNTIFAGFLMARAGVICDREGPSVSGNSEVVGLIINGQRILVTGEPNQTILLPNGTLVVNEQTNSGSKKTGDITVNALHIFVDGVADVVVSSAHADITCGIPVCPGGDFVTGGGWITGTPSGSKGTFGVSGGIKNGDFWGHLIYIDHGRNGTEIRGTEVTAYVAVNAVTRHIEGTAEINGQGGFAYQVDVSDNGEPGRNDTFMLKLSNGYTASGYLGGGNIQIHNPCK